MVCDEQVMLKQQDLFQMLVTRRWKIVVPHKGLTIEWPGSIVVSDNCSALRTVEFVQDW